MASVLAGPGILVTEEVAIPDVKDGFLLRNLCCGVCGSDRRQIASARPGERKIIGHEVVGRIIQAPEEMEGWTGKVVGIAPRMGCGGCWPCRRGHTNLCANLRVVGYQLPGGFSQYLALPKSAASNLMELPGGLSPRVAALAEPLSCVINGLGLSRIDRTQSVMVIGAGPMGQMFIMMAQAKGCSVTALEPDPNRRRFALSHGAAEALDPASRDVPPADLIVVACSNRDAYRLALRVAPPGATINFFGGLDKGVMLDSNRIHYGQLTIHGTSGSTPVHFNQALEALVANPGLGDVVTDVISLMRLPQAIQERPTPNRLSLKMLIDPWMS